MKAVVIGQGYVGLPLAQGAVKAGHDVVGFDLNPVRVAALNNANSVVDDLSDEDISEMLSLGYRASSDPEVCGDADVIVICVPTPLGDGLEPDLSAVRSATATAVTHMRADTLLVLESTTYPGTTASELAPVLTHAGFSIGEDAFLAYSPERIDPGNQTFNIVNTPKVVGADDADSLAKALAFYESFVEQVVPVSGTAEAELTKLLENTYRHVNIGLVNELAVVCHELGIDIWEVIRAASTKPFGFQAFYPGPGVGGHCIPIDPNYLNSRVRQVLGRPFRFVELAENVNASMPIYIVSRVQSLLNEQKKAVNGSSVLLLGVSYKSGISDTRETPATDVAKCLLDQGANVTFYDPCVERWDLPDGRSIPRVSDLGSVAEFEVVVLLQAVPDLDADQLSESAKIFFDTRGVTHSARATRL